MDAGPATWFGERKRCQLFLKVEEPRAVDQAEGCIVFLQALKAEALGLALTVKDKLADKVPLRGFRDGAGGPAFGRGKLAMVFLGFRHSFSDAGNGCFRGSCV